MKKLILIMVLCMSPFVRADNIIETLPTNIVLSADVMSLQSPKRIETLIVKMKQAISQKSDWWMEYAKKHNNDDGILPYHPNMGISPEEYSELTLYLKNGLSLSKTGNIELTFKERNGLISIHTTPRTPVDGIQLSNSSATTPLGIADEITEINNEDKNSATGPWHGTQWRYQNVMSFTKAKMFKIALGKLSGKNTGILYYDVKDVDMAKDKKNMYYSIIYFPLNGENQ